jgi:DNA polymerase-3 subunit gamma/tau
MAYQVLARKYRPQRFSDVAGQDHVTRTLLNALSQNRIAHGYIFSGHRGIGKTTIARILAMALNCRREIGSPERPTPEPCETCESCTEIRAGNAVDVIEIDAATNRGIDEIRELRDAARYRPARDRYKIYILDEAHQITDAAFNALLKTLEEPPDHVIFMMATTQPEDIPQTIRSRSQHFSFHAVSFEDILKELRAIAAKENVGADETALSLLAEAGDGSMRDALSIMDQAIASAPLEDGRANLNAEQIRELMGTVPNTAFEKLLERVSEGNSTAVMEEANALLNAGNSASQIARQFVRYLRNCLMAKLGGENTALLEISHDERARASRSSLLFSEEELTRFLQLMLRTFDELNYRQEPRFHLELGLMKLVHLQRLLPVEELLSQLAGRPASAPRPTTAGTSGAARISPGAPPRSSILGQTSASNAPLRSDAAAPVSPATARPRQAPTAEPERPSFSPFEADRNRKRGNEEAFAPGIEPSSTTQMMSSAKAEPRLASSPVLTPESSMAIPQTSRAGALETGVAVAVAEEEPMVSAPEFATNEIPVATIDIEDAASEVQPSSSIPASNLDLIRNAIVAALDENGHNTAAALLSEGKWTESGDTLEAEMGVKKLMLGLVMSPDAEKIARATLRGLGVQKKFQVVAGEASGGTNAPRPAPQGSIQAQALENPLVKQAQELFRAEVRSVLDLRDRK